MNQLLTPLQSFTMLADLRLAVLDLLSQTQVLTFYLFDAISNAVTSEDELCGWRHV